MDGSTRWSSRRPTPDHPADQLDRIGKQAGEVKLESSPGARFAQLSGKQIRLLIRARRARGIVFGNDLFSDPAWDILLEAYAAELDQVRISVSALCGAAGVPATTGLRWVKKLEQDGWLVRCEDPLDSRRSWIGLSAAGAAAMSRYMHSIRGVVPPL
jgi:DNA-binding MarR family transcriptional regulator